MGCSRRHESNYLDNALFLSFSTVDTHESFRGYNVRQIDTLCHVTYENVSAEEPRFHASSLSVRP